MSSNYKWTETRLVAIYKLQFYKNKKNWKLYEDVKKEPPQPPSPLPKDKLNKTYNVKEIPELDYDLEQVSPHNQAFLQDEPEDAPDAQPPSDPPSLPASPQPLYRPRSWPNQMWGGDRTELPWQDPQQVRMNTVSPTEDARDVQPPSDPPSLPASPQPLYRPGSWPNQVWGGDRTEPPWQDPQQEWCGVEAEGVRDQLAYDQCDEPLNRDNTWKPEPQLDLKPAVDPLDPHGEYLTPAQMRQTAQEWLTTHGYSDSQEKFTDTLDESGVMDDSSDFIRGAHYAPHSSEIELSITQECPCTCSSLRDMTNRQLSRAILRHQTTLALLLQELAIRQRLITRGIHHPPGFPPGVPPGFPPGMPLGMPPGMPLGMPPGMSPGMPLGMPTGMPPGMPLGMPPGMPLGMPPGMPLGMPPGMPPEFGTDTGRGRGRLHAHLRRLGANFKSIG